MPLTAGAFECVRDFVRERAAIALESGKEYLVESRLSPLARREGFMSVDELVESVCGGEREDLQQQVLEAMTTNETSWFRDITPFEALRKVVLPALVEARRPARSLDVWSAA